MALGVEEGSAVGARARASERTMWRSRLHRALREPLLHFLIAGAVLFAVMVANSPDTDEGGNRIVITEGDLMQMLIAWRAQGRPEPTPLQFQAMLESKIREEVLYREALAMGLDRDDTIVKRRMAQKMDFLAEDISALREPTREELRAWLANHPQTFALPPRITFYHLYFSFDEHAGATQQAARAVLPSVSGLRPGSAEAKAHGDRFMFQDNYAESTPQDVASEFGKPFADALFTQPTGQWSGPIESGYGWHLVYVDDVIQGRLPDFEEIEAQVEADWVANQREEFKEAAYQMMREKYEIVLPDLDTVPADDVGQ